MMSLWRLKLAVSKKFKSNDGERIKIKIERQNNPKYALRIMFVFIPSASPPVIMPEQKKIRNETYAGDSCLFVSKLKIKKTAKIICSEISILKIAGLNFFPVNTRASAIMLD